MNKKEILFISKGIHAASTRYRALNYFPFFEAEGWQVRHITANNAHCTFIKILYAARRASIVVVVRKLFNRFYPLLLRLCSPHLIFDLDDAIFCRSNGSPSRQRERRFQKMVQNCDQVWAGNSYLAQYALRENPSVIVLPTSLTPGKYVQNTDKTTEFIDLVWIGSSSTRKYLESALGFLEDAAEKCPYLRLKIVSDFELQSSKISILNIPWSEEVEAEALASSHIGIAPMSNDAWTRGKCGLKVLQYMAAGLPVISSPIGVNRDIIENGLNGFLATEPEEWIFDITKLATDPALRDRLGQSGQRQVADHYSVDATFQKMMCLVQELTDTSDIC